MIFVLHYILLNAASPAMIMLIALYLQTWSDASLSEIGTLLMVLPFVSIIIKPLFCALADRQQAHKSYLMATCLFILLGYGSLIIYPFYPDFIKEHGRLVWFLECLGVIVGFSAFGINWSLGDALAVNAARVRGIPWGSYRVWGTVSWGVFGCLVGQINEVDFLPKYTPAVMLLMVAMITEMLLLAFWPSVHFDMSREGPAKIGELDGSAGGAANGFDPKQQQQRAEANERASLAGTLRGTARLNARLVGAVANALADDIGQSLRSSLKLEAPRKRPALADLLAEHANFTPSSPISSAALSSAGQQVQPAPGSPRLGDSTNHNHATPGSRSSTLTGTAKGQLALTSTHSLSSASGHAIANKLSGYPTNDRSLSRAVANESSRQMEEGERQQRKSVEDLQMVLLRLLVKRDKSILKYLAIFTVYGVLFFVHITYFFLHVEQICKEKSFDFSKLIGLMCVAHSVSEIIGFTVVVPRLMPRMGRTGSILTIGVLLTIRYTFYGTYFAALSPYLAIATETCHGFSYAIVYSLITEIAIDSVNQVDDFLPELIERKIVDPSINSDQLKLPLRATMQGVFSGAFDGLGQGIGALSAGIYLDYYSFVSLWQCCALMSMLVILLYPLAELRACCSSKKAPSKLVA